MKKIVLTLFLLFISIGVFAHVPYVQTRDTRNVKIPVPIGKSLAYYMDFENENDVDMLSFSFNDNDFTPGQTIEDFRGFTVDLIVTDENGVTGRLVHLGSLVPGCNIYSNILPRIAIVGPEQEYLISPGNTTSLPFEVKEGEGVYIINNDTQGELWYEENTFKSYFDQKKKDLIITKAGEYEIYIWEPTGKIGDYVVEFGHVEVFGFKEIMRSLFWLEHLVNDGEIHCDTCKDQLVEVDGENPTLFELIEFYRDLFSQ